jgi:hypothetical protein
VVWWVGARACAAVAGVVSGKHTQECAYFFVVTLDGKVLGWVGSSLHVTFIFVLRFFFFNVSGPTLWVGCSSLPVWGGGVARPSPCAAGLSALLRSAPPTFGGGVCLVSATLCCARPSLARASLFACRALLCLLSPVSDFLAQLRRALEICLSVFRLPLSWKQSPDCLDTQPKPSPYISRVNAVSLTIVLSFTTFSSRHFCPLQTVFVARKVG